MRRYGFLVVTAVLLLAGCGERNADGVEQMAEPTSGEAFTLKVGNTVSDIDPFNITYQEFEEEIEKTFEGRIQVKLFTSGFTDETDADVLDKIRSNTLQMGNTAPNYFADLSGMPEYYVYRIPYLMSTDEELDAVTESEWFMGLNKDFVKTMGAKVFDGGVSTGRFDSSATGKEIHQITDSKGTAIRINQTNQMIALSEGVGVNPQFIAFSEVYTVSVQGTVGGIVTNVPLFYSNGSYDQLKSMLTVHCGESRHFYIINDKFYNPLSDDLRPIIDKDMGKLIAGTRELGVDYLEEAIGRMREKNVIVAEVSKEDEGILRQISMDKMWWDENVSLIPKESVKKILEIPGHADGAQ